MRMQACQAKASPAQVVSSSPQRGVPLHCMQLAIAWVIQLQLVACPRGRDCSCDREAGGGWPLLGRGLTRPRCRSWLYNTDKLEFASLHGVLVLCV